MILPPTPTFSMKSPKHTTTMSPGGRGKCRDFDEDKHDKKKSKGNDKACSLVKNEFPPGKICMLTNEKWAGKFSSKQVDQHTQWNEKCKCCPHCFLQKHCFSDCKKSHPPSFSKCWHRSRHGATDGPGWSLPTSGLLLKRLLTSTIQQQNQPPPNLMVFPIKSTIHQCLEIPFK